MNYKKDLEALILIRMSLIVLQQVDHLDWKYKSELCFSHIRDVIGTTDAISD